jgi:DNA-binding GntR family transcriptional regulator
MFPEEVQHVYEQIKEKILRGEYAQGQPLPEIPLAAEYGMKRTRIRQIIQKLESEALIDRIPNKGAFIKSITPKDLGEIFEMREALEGMAARLAARRRNDNELDRLIALFEKNENSDVEAKVMIGDQLHEFILQSSGNRMIVNTIEPLRMQIRRIWKAGLVIPGRINKAFDEHRDILAALRKKDEDRAERKMREHLLNAFKEYINVILLI